VPSLVLCIALTSPSFLLSLWKQNASTNRRAEVRSFVLFACFASVPFLRRPSLNQNHVPTTAPTAPATWRAYRTFSATPCSTSTGSCDSPPLCFSLFLSRIHNTCLFPEPGPRSVSSLIAGCRSGDAGGRPRGSLHDIPTGPFLAS
jgi:hypothetical protein